MDSTNPTRVALEAIALAEENGGEFIKVIEQAPDDPALIPSYSLAFLAKLYDRFVRYEKQTTTERAEQADEVKSIRKVQRFLVVGIGLSLGLSLFIFSGNFSLPELESAVKVLGGTVGAISTLVALLGKV